MPLRPPDFLYVRSQSEWAAPYPLGPSAGAEVGGAVRQGLGLFQVWEREEIQREAGCQVPAHPGGGWGGVEGAGAALLLPEFCNWCSEEPCGACVVGADELWPLPTGMPGPSPCFLGSVPGLSFLLQLCLGRLGFIRGDSDTRPAPLSQSPPPV